MLKIRNEIFYIIKKKILRRKKENIDLPPLIPMIKIKRQKIIIEIKLRISAIFFFVCMW